MSVCAVRVQVSSARKSSHVVPESGYHVCEETGICESACHVGVGTLTCASVHVCVSMSV